MPAAKTTSLRLKPDDKKRVQYIQAQLEKSTGVSVSMADVLVAGIRELEHKLKSKEKHDSSESKS